MALLADVNVRSGSTLRIGSAGTATLVVGTNQVQVAAGGELHLQRLVVADSEQSSAVLAEGTFTASYCTFLRCTTTTNAVFAVAEQYVPDGASAFLGAAGGAVFSRGMTTMEGCAFFECSASGAKVAALGGALVVDIGSHATLRRTELRRNSAVGGSFRPMGGAIFAFLGAELKVVGSSMNENSVAGGDESANVMGGAVFLFGSHAILEDTELSNNTAYGPSSNVLGGAVAVTIGSSLAVSGCSFRGNVARCSWSRGSAEGGAIFAVSGSVTIASSEIADNAVQAEGALSAKGGAIALNAASTLRVDATAIVRNRATGGGVATVGGAVFADVGADAVLQNCKLFVNSVRGASVRGGAISSQGTLRLANSTLGRNRVTATSSRAFGGALHVLQGTAYLLGCQLHHNIAESLPGSTVAGYGAVYNEGGEVVIDGSRLWGNACGGNGVVQKEYSPALPLHVGTIGTSMKLDRCEIFDAGDGEAEPVLANPGSVWLYAATSLVLQGSLFRSSTAGQVLLASDPMSQVLIRGCQLENVIISADGVHPPHRPLGVVNSTFEPALENIVPTVPPPQCAVQVAGERMCDERARGEAVPSGGVQCSCAGAGLRYAPGLPEDGQRCQQDA